MKTIIKKILIFMSVLIIFYSFSLTLPVYALDFTKADNFITKGSEEQGLSDESLTDIGTNFASIGKVLVYIGAGIVVGGMGYLGIMYMVSPPEKQGKLKEQLIGLVVAAVVIFGAYSIWATLVTILSSVVTE